MKILIACEFSGIVREAFSSLNAGHTVYSCDLLPTDIKGNHIQGDVLKVINDGWDLIIAHPPCTHLSVSGAARWAEKVADGRQPAAIKFVENIWDADCPLIAIENPVGALSSRSKLGKATQYIQPYEFGHAEQKKTGLWLKGLPKLVPTDVVDVSNLPDNQRQRLHYLPPSKDRWKLRSLTFPGIAKAMADQWGNLGQEALQTNLFKVL